MGMGNPDFDICSDIFEMNSYDAHTSTSNRVYLTKIGVQET